MKVKLLTLSFLTLLWPATRIMALEILPVYAGFGYGVARYVGPEIRDPLLLANQKAKDDVHYYELYVGLDMTSYFSIEAAYAHFGTAKHNYRIRDDLVSIISPNSLEEISAKRYALMGVLEFPLPMGFSIYGTGGYAYYDFNRTLLGGFSPVEGSLAERLSHGDHGAEYGFGAKWKPLPLVSIRGQWTQSAIGDRSMQSNRLSVEIHF